MKLIRHLLMIAISAIITSNCKAQSYATLQYWGNKIPLDRSFFEILNNNYSAFMKDVAPTWKHYDFRDYQDIYVTDVTNLQSHQFLIIVTEANELQWYNAVKVIPGTTGETGRSKKSSFRAGWILYQVILPSLQSFAKLKQ